MGNPWKDIRLSDYESHMSLEGVGQLQELSLIMKGQFNEFAASSAMVLGVAGGNGLEHVDAKKYQRIYGVDVNPNYLEAARERHKDLENLLELLCLDVTTEVEQLPQADLLIADLFVEYVGYEVFQNAVNKVTPAYVSCVIQINEAEGFVSESPYLHAFDRLQEVHHQMEREKLTESLMAIGYGLINVREHPLPNGKKLVRLDYSRKKMIFRASNGAEILERIIVDENEAIRRYPMINHALVIVKVEDDYLLGFHKWRDDWETFGGLIEPGESLRECIKRECLEELGLDDLDFTYLGLVHYNMPPSYWVKEWHEEYGGLYGVSIPREMLKAIGEKRRDKDEIGEIRCLRDLKKIGAKIDEINEKLLDFFHVNK